MNWRPYLPLTIAVGSGVLTLLSLILGLDGLAHTLLEWATFLAAAALLTGILNLLARHVDRLRQERNLYSGVLVGGMVLVFLLAVGDGLGLTNGGVEAIFYAVQAPSEAALTALLAFVLIFAGFRLQQSHRGWRATLFLATAILILVSDALGSDALLAGRGLDALRGARAVADALLISAGMRGVLIGVALGAIVLSLRVLAGWERPYEE